MNYLVYDLGWLEKGKVVEVTLSAQANVKLMSALDYSYYQKGQRHSYYGGWVKVSPYRIEIPTSFQHWYVTVDLGGYEGKVSASCTVLSDRE